jgi:hypothetical protein
MWRMCWHDWSKWTTYVWEGNNFRGSGITRTQQVRICAKCGKEVHRLVDHAAGGTYAEAARIGKLTPSEAVK